MHTNARKPLYEKLHPETRAKVAGGKARQGRASDKLSFAKDTAKKIGKSHKTVERNAKRGKVGRDWLSDVAGTALDKGDEIDRLKTSGNRRSGGLPQRQRACYRAG
jgi:hypothetical protein